MTDLVYLMLFVAAGSAVGGLARFIVSGLVARAVGETFPWGTMTVNVTGAFLIGIVSVMAESLLNPDRPEAWPLLVTGILGSYTTVSSFSLQTLALARDGQMFRAIGNVLLSLLVCLSGVAAGMASAPQLALWTLP
ncbi:MAG: fluoride efflux transporter CrcB [Hyphomonas sp.]